MRHHAIIILATILLAGCATEFTPSSGGDGYSETQLSPTSFQGAEYGVRPLLVLG